MVKKSFFSRLFGRGESRDVPVEIAPRSSSSRGQAPGNAANRVATKSRLPAVEFEDEAPAASDPKRAPNRTNGSSGGSSGGSNGGSHGNHGGKTSNGSQGASPKSPVLEQIVPSSAKIVTEPMPTDTKRGSDAIATSFAKAEPIQTTEMPKSEELALKLQEGFTGISSVLRGIDSKMDQQQKTSEELIVSVRRIPDMMKDMPDASRAGIELLNTISSILEFQGRSTNELLTKMRDLPSNLDAMEQRFQEQVGALARTSEQADRSARETQQRLTAEFQGVKRVVEDVQVATSRRQESLVDELRKHQSAQDARVEELLKRNSSSTRLVVFLLVIAVVALLVAVYGMQRG